MSILDLFGFGEQLGRSLFGGQEQPAQQFSTDRGTGSALPRSLKITESGGNWRAQNSVMGAGGKRGHFGRAQFGQARLAEAARAGAIPVGTTPQQFMASPELQIAAENWHFADIDRKITENGFDQMVGKTVRGVPITMDGLRAVAHLGGTRGMEKFVRTGGRYNPSDKFGTSLLDYLKTHQGGSPARPQRQAGMPPIDGIMQRPRVAQGHDKPFSGLPNSIGEVSGGLMRQIGPGLGALRQGVQGFFGGLSPGQNQFGADGVIGSRLFGSGPLAALAGMMPPGRSAPGVGIGTGVGDPMFQGGQRMGDFYQMSQGGGGAQIYTGAGATPLSITMRDADEARARGSNLL